MKKQISFENLNASNSCQSGNGRKTHGGSLSKGKRKTRRPLDRKNPIHLVLKSTNSYTLLRRQSQVHEIIKGIGAKFGIKMHSSAIQYDHIHLHFSFQNRKVYVRWIRALTGILAQKIKGLKFKFLPYTRVVASGGRDFTQVNLYIEKNQVEANFLIRIHAHIDRTQRRLDAELRRWGFECVLIAGAI